MSATLANDPVLSRVRLELDVMYGNDIERVVLFGSRARGEARADSDYDVAVFLKNLSDRWVALDQLASLRVRLLDDIGAFVDIKPYSVGAYRERTALMHEIRQDGIDL